METRKRAKFVLPVRIWSSTLLVAALIWLWGCRPPTPQPPVAIPTVEVITLCKRDDAHGDWDIYIPNYPGMYAVAFPADHPDFGAWTISGIQRFATSVPFGPWKVRYITAPWRVYWLNTTDNLWYWTGTEIGSLPPSVCEPV